jgi:hypothetical protein
MPDVELEAGDTNGDGTVNLFDLVSVSARYGSGSPSAGAEDVNGDGEVDLLGLVLVSVNYGSSGHDEAAPS